MSKLLGGKIKELRTQSNLTLEQLAELSDSSKGYIWEIENNQGINVSAQKLFNISKVFGISVDYLLDDNWKINVATEMDDLFMMHYLNSSDDKRNKVRKIFELL